MSDAVIIGIVALAVLGVERIWSSVQIRKILQDSNSCVNQAILLSDRLHERQQILLADVMDRFMSQDFEAYKAQVFGAGTEGGFETPIEEFEDQGEEGGIERPGAFPRTPRAEDLEDTMVREEAAILAEDFDEVGNPR